MLLFLVAALPCVYAVCNATNATIPRYGLVSREITMHEQPVRGTVSLISTCQFSVQHLEINNGSTVMWMGAINETSTARTALTPALNSSMYLSAGFFIPEVTFFTELSLDDFPVLVLFDSQSNSVLGSVRLDGPNPAFLPTSLSNCLQLAPNYRVRWEHINAQEIDIAMEAVVSPVSWLAFGPTAPGVTNRAMGGADVTITTASPPKVVDSYLSSYLECFQGIGACADTETVEGLNGLKGPGKSDSSLVHVQRLGSISFARFRRLRFTGDYGFDHTIASNSSQIFVWGGGNYLNTSSGIKFLTHATEEGVSYGSVDIFLDKAIFNCKPFPVQPNISLVNAQNTSADQFEEKFLGGAQASLADSAVTLFWKLDDIAKVVKFGLRSRYPQQSGYLSLAIGSIMAGSKTWVSVLGAPELQVYRMGGQTADSFSVADEGVSGYAWFSSNGIYSFEFSRPYGELDVENNIPFIWALGPVWHTPPTEDDYHTVRSPEAIYINLRSGQVSSAPGNQSIVAHGVLLAISWGVLVPLGVALMRGARLIGRPKWQLYHPWLNAFAAVLSFIGVIVIVVMLYDNQAKHLFSEHAKLGLATLVLFGFQLVFGLLKPSLGRVSVSGRNNSEHPLTLAEVSKHTSVDSCWIVVRERVYDVTPWLALHPGGKKVLLENAGKDASELFEKSHASPDKILKEHAHLCVGVLVDTSSKYKPSATAAINATPAPATEMGPLASSSSPSTKSFTLQDIAGHSTPQSCLLAIHGKVYDVTQWLDRHPGGRELLLANGGTDATEVFDKNHEVGEEILKRKSQLCVGVIAENTISTAEVTPVVHDPVIPLASPVSPILSSSATSESQKQRLWFWTHRILGLITLCLSWATIYEGLDLLPSRGFPDTTTFAPLALAWFILLTLFMGYFFFLHKWAVPQLDKKSASYLAAAGCVMLMLIALALSIIAGVSANPVVEDSGAVQNAVLIKDPKISQCRGLLSGCPIVNCALIGDGWCDAYAPYNTAECLWDGGDCCNEQAGLFRCLDPMSPLFNKSSPTGFQNITYRNERYSINSNGQVRTTSAENFVGSYNNFYEFGYEKSISERALAQSSLFEGPWNITIDGLVENSITLDVKELINKMYLEERNYRHRCVEAWSIVVPWVGFPLYALLDIVKPLSTAKYVKFTSFDKPFFPGGLPWPYVEGLTIEEAQNELAFISVGSYGTKLPPQSGAPIRLTIPWKYGFKSIKSIVRIELTSTRPAVFWEIINANEYGFWSNVNPKVNHPRWSQANERPLGGSAAQGILPTQLFNGYGELVSYLYTQYTNEALYK